MTTIAEVKLKPCPWCKKTPEMSLPLGPNTWLWNIHCVTDSCLMKPKSRHVSLRKKGKKDANKIFSKLDFLATIWNSGNDLAAFEAKRIDITKLLEPDGIPQD